MKYRHGANILQKSTCLEDQSSNYVTKQFQPFYMPVSGSNLSCLGFNAVFNSDYCITIYHYVPHDSNQLYLNNKETMTFK